MLKRMEYDNGVRHKTCASFDMVMTTRGILRDHVFYLFIYIQLT